MGACKIWAPEASICQGALSKQCPNGRPSVPTLHVFFDVFEKLMMEMNSMFEGVFIAVFFDVSLYFCCLSYPNWLKKHLILEPNTFTVQPTAGSRRPFGQENAIFVSFWIPGQCACKFRYCFLVFLCFLHLHGAKHSPSSSMVRPDCNRTPLTQSKFFRTEYGD